MLAKQSLSDPTIQFDQGLGFRASGVGCLGFRVGVRGFGLFPLLGGGHLDP